MKIHIVNKADLLAPYLSSFSTAQPISGIRLLCNIFIPKPYVEIVHEIRKWIQLIPIPLLFPTPFYIMAPHTFQNNHTAKVDFHTHTTTTTVKKSTITTAVASASHRVVVPRSLRANFKN